MSTDLNKLLSEFNQNIKLDYDLKKKNWFNIGGKSKVFFKASNLKQLVSFLKKINNSERIYILGAGSNILISDKLFDGIINIENGKLNTADIYIEGSSLLLGADLTGKAFTRSIFGEYGQYIVAIGLLLFAFSTAIAWSYYGDRATVHLFGEKWVIHYRVIYVGAFFLASIIDTKIVWDIATVIGPIATVPNLIAILLLRREIKELQSKYTSF